MLNPESRRALVVSAALCVLYLIAALVSRGMRDVASIAAVSAAVSGVAAAVAHRWSLYVLGALLLMGLAFLAVAIVFAASANPDLTWSDRVVGVAKILGRIGPLLAFQVWAFSVVARKDHDSAT